MPFDTATQFIQDYMYDRKEHLINTQPLNWSTEGQSTLKAMVDEQFDGTPENDEWERMRQTPETSHSNPMIGIRNKIGWLAAGNRDLRTQFAAATGCRQRVALDHVRYSILRLNWALKGVKRFVEIVNSRLDALGSGNTPVTTTPATGSGFGRGIGNAANNSQLTPGVL